MIRRESWQECYDTIIICQFQRSYIDLIKILKSHYHKRFYNKGHLNLATEILKGINPGVSAASHVTHQKSNINKS